MMLFQLHKIIAKKAEIEKAKKILILINLKQLKLIYNYYNQNFKYYRTDPIALAILNDPIEVGRILKQFKHNL